MRVLRQRPGLRIAPVATVKEASVGILVAIAGAHHEHAYRRVILDAGRNALQEVIEPPQVKRAVEVRDRGLGAERDITGVWPDVPTVRPRPHQHALRRRLQFPQPEKIPERAGEKDVVPAADVNHRNVRGLRVVLFPVDHRILPERVVVRMLEEVEVPRFVLRRDGEWIEAAAHWLQCVPVFHFLLREQRLDCGRRCIGEQLAPRPRQLATHLVCAAITNAVIPRV